METKPQRQAWIRWLTGPIAWTVYFMAVYLLVEAACHLPQIDETAVFPLTLLFTFITALLIGIAGYRSGRSGSDSFADKSSISINALFFFLTLAVGASVLVLKPC